MPFFSQVVVVDTGSTDRTKEIIKEVGAELYEFPWPDSFSAARNESLKYAKGKWVFWMDADDTLPFTSGEIILENALTAPKEISAFVVPVQFVDEGPGAGTRVDHVKLFRNDPRVRFEFRIHEQNLSSLRALGGEIARSAAVVLHSGYDVSDEGQARKRERDEKLLKLDLAEHPDHPFVLFNLGMTAHFTNAHEDAIQWLTRCIEVSEPSESHVRKAYALLAGSQNKSGASREALATIEHGLSVVPEDPELHFQAAMLLTEMKRYPEARLHYEVIGNDIGGHFSSIDMSILTFKRYHNLAGVCSLMNDYPAAKHWWHKALECSPTFMPSANDMFSNALEVGDYSTAKWVVDHVRSDIGPCEEWVSMGAAYYSKVAGAGEVEPFLRQAVEKNPYCSGPRIVLARNLLQSGREAEAQEHLEMLDLLGNAEGAFYLGVGATRRGDLRLAFTWMQRASELNPGHEETMRQRWNLERALEANNPLIREPAARDLEESWKDEVIRLSHLPVVQHPLVYGRDRSNPYYDFLYRLVENYKPRLVVELGTCSGGSTSYLAAANPDTRVISVDIVQHPEVVQRLNGLPNVELWTYDTRDPAIKARLEKEGGIDLLFIDTEHSYAQAKAEFELFSKLVTQDGFILFDDIDINSVSKFWNELLCDKLELNHLHWSGFGIARPHMTDF